MLDHIEKSCTWWTLHHKLLCICSLKHQHNHSETKSKNTNLIKDQPRNDTTIDNAFGFLNHCPFTNSGSHHRIAPLNELAPQNRTSKWTRTTESHLQMDSHHTIEPGDRTSRSLFTIAPRISKTLNRAFNSKFVIPNSNHYNPKSLI